MLKTTCHFLLLLVGFGTLTHRKDYDRSPILVGHHQPPHQPRQVGRKAPPSTPSQHQPSDLGRCLHRRRRPRPRLHPHLISVNSQPSDYRWPHYSGELTYCHNRSHQCRSIRHYSSARRGRIKPTPPTHRQEPHNAPFMQARSALRTCSPPTSSTTIYQICATRCSMPTT